jgi:DNA topoisomerase-1
VIDKRLVDAQETRRILDRLYGYEVSPVLWKKSPAGCRPDGCSRSRRASWSSASASVWPSRRPNTGSARDLRSRPFEARLIALDGARVAQGRDFTPSGALSGQSVTRLDEEAARSLAARLGDASFSVRSVDERPYRRKPAAPFRTATLQQEASRKLRYSAQTTMRLAQRLYEAGHITYMRTDSTTLSESALDAARAKRDLFGANPSREAAPIRACRCERAGGS